MINITSARRLRPEDLCHIVARLLGVIHDIERLRFNAPFPAKPVFEAVQQIDICFGA